MLQHVSHLALSAPLDRGLIAGEGLDAAVAGPPAGDDFLALLEQAEGRDGIPSAGDVVPGGSAADQGEASLTAGLATGLSPAMFAPTRQAEPPGTTTQDSDDAADGIVLVDDIKGDGGAGLGAGVATGPANAASLPSMIALQGAVSAWPVSTEGSAQPAAGAAPFAAPAPALLPQEEVPPFRLPAAASGLMQPATGSAPAARAALVAKVPPDEVAGGEQPAAPSASDLDSLAHAQVASQDWAEGSEPVSAFRAEPGPTHPTGSTPSLMVSSALPEGRGLSMPADPSIAGAGSLPGYLSPGLPSPPAATSLALPYQRLFPPQLSAQVAPAVLSMGVVPGADGGPGRLTVAIRPAELGTLQIITERMEDGTARIAVLAERPETLQLILRDASTLETALRAAGVDEGGGLSLTFGLASQGQGDRGEDARREPGRIAGRLDGADAKPIIIASAPAVTRTSLLDLSL